MKGKKKVKEPAGMNIPEIFAALAMLEKERGIPQTFMMDKIIQAVTTAYKRDHKDVEKRHCGRGRGTPAAEDVRAEERGGGGGLCGPLQRDPR